MKVIGPADLNNNDKPILHSDEEYVLTQFNQNICKTIYYYYSYNYKNIANNNTINIDKNIKINQSQKYDNIFINEFSIKKKYYKNNETSSLYYRIKLIKQSLKLLNNGGKLYLEYFNIGNNKTFNIIQELFTNFESIKFIRSKLYENSLIGGYYIFQNYLGKHKSKTDLKKFIIKTQNNIYRSFDKYVIKCNMLLSKMKEDDYLSLIHI